LGAHFASSVRDELVAHGLVAKTAAVNSHLVTPRRLAVLISSVSAQAELQEREVQGPSTSAPQAAAAGFAKKHGLAVEALQRQSTPKGEVFVARIKAGGASLETVLAGVIDKSLKKLPIPKMMRWGDGDEQFVRPVHGLVMLHGEQVIPGKVLGLSSGKQTRGHRFMGQRSCSPAPTGTKPSCATRGW
jgi:glycyl-tRNA synthetase beta chain